MTAILLPGLEGMEQAWHLGARLALQATAPLQGLCTGCPPAITIFLAGNALRQARRGASQGGKFEPRDSGQRFSVIPS